MSRYVDFYLIGELVDSHGNVHYEDLKNLPTANVVEVIRCKDCKHFKQIEFMHKPVCLMPTALRFRENDYCSYGKRREDDKG